MSIQFAIYTCPPIPTGVSSPDPSSKDSGLFSPLSCTLIYTPSTALLIDCPGTVAAATELAAWIKSTMPVGCTLKYFVTSHAHGDHFFGAPVLQDAFPGLTAIASKNVIEGIALQYSPQLYDGLWKSLFPPSEAGTGMPEQKIEFVPPPSSNAIDLDGHKIEIFDVPHGDTHANSFIHVPELELVVAGDIVYNGDCHQHLSEACTQEKRDQWIEGLMQIAALKPKIIVPGHTFTPTSEPNEAVAMSMIESTKGYIRGFEDELVKAESGEDLFNRMKNRFPRWNLWILEGSCLTSYAATQSAS